jgi:hypothetical protein
VETAAGAKNRFRLVVLLRAVKLMPCQRAWPMLCTIPLPKGRKGVTMDFAIILIVSNTLLAAFIYFVVTRIWQD